jgi:sodium/bile acid cotransporter 7
MILLIRSLLFPHAAMSLLLLLSLCAGYLPVSNVFAADLSDADKYEQVRDMYASYREDFPGVSEIDASAAIALIDNPDVVFIDVRKKKEQAISMIPGAVSEDAFIADLDRYRDKKIIAYCTISYRSGKLAKRLGQKSVRVINLKEGLLGWVHAEGPLVDDGKPIQRLHVYGRKWDLAPARIETVY